MKWEINGFDCDLVLEYISCFMITIPSRIILAFPDLFSTIECGFLDSLTVTCKLSLRISELVPVRRTWNCDAQNPQLAYHQTPACNMYCVNA